MVVVVFCYMGETNMEYESTFPEIRPVAGGDAEDISFLCREGLGYHCDRILVENRIAQLDTAREAVFVAVIDETVIGFVHVERYNALYFETMANILGIAVSDRYRRQGIGKALLTRAEAWAQEHDITLMRLNTGTRRKGAHEFYKQEGYRLEKEQFRFAKRLDE